MESTLLAFTGAECREERKGRAKLLRGPAPGPALAFHAGMFTRFRGATGLPGGALLANVPSLAGLTGSPVPDS